MDQDHPRGITMRAEGSVMEAIGKVTGNGATQMSAGWVWTAVGPAFGEARTAFDGDE